MIQSVGSFIRYFDGIRRRTLHFIDAVPPGKLNWSPAPGEYTCADIIRHLMAAELMFVGAAATGSWKYAGHTSARVSEREPLLAQLAQAHAEATQTLRGLADTQLNAERPSLDGPPVKAWRWLMAMVEHEVHHRSQLAMYLMLLGIQPPHIYGLGVEDVIARATG